VDVTSQALGARGAAVAEAEKVTIGGAQQVKRLQSDLCMTGPPPVQEQQAGGESEPGAREEDDRCLYARTPWEDDVIADRRDVDEFMVAQQTIARTLSVST
jgi:hypothetical protein